MEKQSTRGSRILGTEARAGRGAKGIQSETETEGEGRRGKGGEERGKERGRKKRWRGGEGRGGMERKGEERRLFWEGDSSCLGLWGHLSLAREVGPACTGAAYSLNPFSLFSSLDQLPSSSLKSVGLHSGPCLFAF